MAKRRRRGWVGVRKRKGYSFIVSLCHGSAARLQQAPDCLGTRAVFVEGPIAAWTLLSVLPHSDLEQRKWSEAFERCQVSYQWLLFFFLALGTDRAGSGRVNEEVIFFVCQFPCKLLTTQRIHSKFWSISKWKWRGCFFFIFFSFFFLLLLHQYGWVSPKIYLVHTYIFCNGPFDHNMWCSDWRFCCSQNFPDEYWMYSKMFDWF